MEVEKIVVTRHEGLVAYLREIGLIDASTPVVAHASIETVVGKHVIGVLPLSLAAAATRVTEIPMALPQELRGKELSLEDMRRFAGAPVTYVVRMELEGF